MERFALYLHPLLYAGDQHDDQQCAQESIYFLIVVVDCLLLRYLCAMQCMS